MRGTQFSDLNFQRDSFSSLEIFLLHQSNKYHIGLFVSFDKVTILNTEKGPIALLMYLIYPSFQTITITTTTMNSSAFLKSSKSVMSRTTSMRSLHMASSKDDKRRGSMQRYIPTATTGVAGTRMGSNIALSALHEPSAMMFASQPQQQPQDDGDFDWGQYVNVDSSADVSSLDSSSASSSSSSSRATAVAAGGNPVFQRLKAASHRSPMMSWSSVPL